MPENWNRSFPAIKRQKTNKNNVIENYIKAHEKTQKSLKG